MSVHARYTDRCFVSEDNRFVYLFMPRNGSQSFRNCGLFGSETPIQYSDSFRNKIKIVILREPIERVISLFLWQKRRVAYKWKEDEDFLREFENYLIGLTKSFNELTIPQCKYLSRKDLTIADIEEVFMLDNYNNDVKNFSTKYNLDLEIGHLNQSNRERFNTLLQFINDNDKIKNNLIEVYNVDIELYNSQTKRSKILLK